MAKRLFLRGLGGAIFAGFLALAMLAPTIDMIQCAGELEPAASAHVEKEAVQTVTRDGGQGQPLQPYDGNDGSCMHGHCHHGVGAAKLVDRVAFKVRLSSLKVGLAPDVQHTSAPQMELLRPPRA